VSFPLAAKRDVKGGGIQPLYNWLTKISENGQMNSEVKGDFQKYLVDSNGELMGVFVGSVSPLDQQIVSNITGSSN
jgi:glutathione peroxidase